MGRIDCWASKLLSYAGRIQLIKSVLFGVQAYWSQVFILPQKVIKLIQTACRCFLWSGKSRLTKRALVAWEYVCKPKIAGGWNIPNLKSWNQAAIGKLLWCLEQKRDKMWIKWVHEYYIKDRDINTMCVPLQASWIVQKILGARKYFQNLQDEDVMKQGQYSIKKAYCVITGPVERMEWNRLLTMNCAMPKCVFITWLAVLRRLATCDRLEKFGVACDMQCCLCMSEDENVDHLFFKCAFAAQVWKLVATWCGVREQVFDCRQEVDYMITQCKSKTKKQLMYRVMLSIAVYGIWKEMNYRRFQGKFNSVEQVAKQCKLSIASRVIKDKALVKMMKN